MNYLKLLEIGGLTNPFSPNAIDKLCKPVLNELFFVLILWRLQLRIKRLLHVVINMNLWRCCIAMEMIDIYDELGQQSGKTEDKYEAHSKALIHKVLCLDY